MLFPNFTPFNLFSVMYFSASFFITLIALTDDWKMTLKECAYLALGVIFFSVVSTVDRDIPHFIFRFLREFAPFPFMVFYLCRFRRYSVKKAIILSTVAGHIVLTLTYIITSAFIVSFPDFNAVFVTQYSTNNVVTYVEIIHVLLFLPVFTVVTVALVRLSVKLRAIVNQSPNLQTIFMYVCITITVLFFCAIYLMRHLGLTPGFINLYRNTSGLIIIFIFICFYLSVVFIDAKHKRLKKIDELKKMQYYISELEQQQTAMRKFRHDYQNILLSLDGFINDGDLEGLREYYTSTVKAGTKNFTNDCYALSGLSKVKPREIKSIIAAKLMMAQNLGINTVFEADQDIESIPLDPVALVRMLGIILDNAIEALAELGEGTLRVGCFNGENGVIFIVENTCPPDMPPLHVLLQPGFSSKGEARGLGLPILTELVNAHPNVMLTTKADKDRFTQRLSVEI